MHRSPDDDDNDNDDDDDDLISRMQPIWVMPLFQQFYRERTTSKSSTR